MRAACFSALIVLLTGGAPAVAEDWIALWQIDGIFYGMAEGGDVLTLDAGTGQTALLGSFGAGPWASFGRVEDQLLALREDGQVWLMESTSGQRALHQTLPAGHEWCALQQHPDIRPWCAITCDGEVWSLWEPLRLLADVGLHATGRWICIANADDSYFATLESGDTWQGIGEYFFPAGTYGPGPWVGFSRTYGGGGDFVALNESGEIWAHAWSGEPSLLLALPSDRVWCALMTGPLWNTGPGFALTCDGEIWSVESPPEFIGTFASPTPIENRTWGRIKASWRPQRP